MFWGRYINKREHDACFLAVKVHTEYVEAELARVKSENRDLINALAIQARVTPPFVTSVPIKPGVLRGRKSVWQKTKELERQSRDEQ